MQGSNPGLLLFQQILYQLTHQGSRSFLGVPFITHTEPYTSDTSCQQSGGRVVRNNEQVLDISWMSYRLALS